MRVITRGSLSSILTVVAVLGFTLVPGSLRSVAGGTVLTRNGTAVANIVLAEHPSENAGVAAREFQKYVQTMSGARLAIVTDAQPPSGPAVLIGQSKLTEEMSGLKIPHGRTKNLREEGFVIVCRSNRLVLAGNDEEPYYGTRYAVAEMLNRFGVRWFMPGSFGEVVPHRPTLEVQDLVVQQQPDFPMRNFWEHSRDHMSEELFEWKIHHKLNPRMQDWFGVPSDGSIANFLSKELFEAHPDWFALTREGKRDPHMVCMSSPDMVHHFAELIKEQARAGKRVSAFAPEDGMPRCYCAQCMKRSTAFDGYGSNDRDPWPESSTSQEWFFFVDQVLREVNGELPDYFLASNGYANREIPPELPDFNLSKNLVVMFANICACTIHAYDDPRCWMKRRQAQMVQRWCALSDKVWLYDYNYTMLVSKGTLTPMVHRIRRDIPLLKRYGILGFHDEELCDWSHCGVPSRLVRAALEWNTRADVDALLRDYFSQWFGPAAAPMARYYAALEDAFGKTSAHGHEDVVLNQIYTPKLVARLGRQIAEAENLASTEPEGTRVRVERMIYDILCDYTAMENAKRECRFSAAAQCAERICATETNLNRVTSFMGYWPYQAYGPSWEANRMRSLAAKTEGLEGRLLALLPEVALARSDPFDDGRYARWMGGAQSGREWRPIRTTGGWDNQGWSDRQGHPFKGVMWYTLEMELPETRTQESVWLLAPAVVNEVWVWVNGQYAGHRPYLMPWYRPQALELEITPFIKPNTKNQITFRVLNNIDVWGASGIYERMCVYGKPKP